MKNFPKDCQKFKDGHGTCDIPCAFMWCLSSKERIESENYELFHLNAELENIYRWIKSDSIYSILRQASKSPSIVNGDDDHYIDMLNLSERLRYNDSEENEARKNNFEKNQP